MKKKNLGFTIIELLVVIAIIGVLAAIVLINVTRYIDKGKDSAAQGDLGTLFTNAITFYNENGNFEDINDENDGDPDYLNVITGLETDKMGYTVVDTLAADNSEWCAAVDLKSTADTAYCVDSSGNKKLYSGTAEAACVDGACQ